MRYLKFLKLHKSVSVTKKRNVSHMFRSAVSTLSIKCKTFSYTEVQQSKSMTLRTNAAFFLCNSSFTMLIKAFHTEH